MENDAAKALLSIVREAATEFSTGKAFLDCLRIVLAKISMLDWTSMDKSTQYLVISDVKQKLPGILRTGCHVPQTLVADATISSGLKESVLQVGTRDKLVVSLTATCQAYPGFATKWMALNNVILLDTIADDAIDFGFDVTALETRSTKQIHTTLVALFQTFLAQVEFGRSRLTTEDQKCFDGFLAFILSRRKLKAVRWLHGALDGRLSKVRSTMEQRFVDPMVLFLSRC
ncbi:hypothetical protein F441_21774 [Phytophthora nicotianae CJ01A1]|uniref:Uncharacterized protein n=1 Tax=Phytophthora nicotianae CJ01A1 TaxID=1317063 RepID=W2VT28_PHYNI|nr:hypothetical protein F441_21774 [Phytophthora nicotianae CJ01A1]